MVGSWGGETEPEPKKRGHLRFSFLSVALVFAFVCLRVNRIVKKTKTFRNLVPGHEGGDLAGGCSAAVRLVVQVAVLEVVVVVLWL